MSKNTMYIAGGVAIVLVVVLLMQNSSASKTSNVTTISGGGGWLAGAGSLAAGLGKGIANIWGTSSSEGYSPSVVRGEDAAIGEVN